MGLLYGEDAHMFNNRLGAAYQHLNNVITKEKIVITNFVNLRTAVLSKFNEVLPFGLIKSYVHTNTCIRSFIIMITHY